MGFFKDYEECYSVVITMMRKFSISAQYQIALAMNVCDSLIDDKDKKYRMKQTLYNCLWEIPKAVETGFKCYLEKEIKEIKALLNYHNKNCIDINNCLICKDRITMIDKVSQWGEHVDERKRPTVSIK